MKKGIYSIIAVAMAVALLTGCAKYTKPEFYTLTYEADYTMFTNSGFFVTESNTAPFDYDGLMSVTVEEYSGFLPKTDKKPEIKSSGKKTKHFDDVYGEEKMKEEKPSNDFRSASYQSALQKAFEMGSRHGANGIINLEITPITHTYTLNNKVVTDVIGVRLTGMLIRRK